MVKNTFLTGYVAATRDVEAFVKKWEAEHPGLEYPDIISSSDLLRELRNLRRKSVFIALEEN